MPKDNRLNGFASIARANAMAQLNGLRNNEKLQHAIHIREASRILGVPAKQLEEEMLAGGDIHINEGLGTIGLFVLAAAVLISAALLAGAWLYLSDRRPQPAAPAPAATAQPTPAQTLIDVEVIKGPR